MSRGEVEPTLRMQTMQDTRQVSINPIAYVRRIDLRYHEVSLQTSPRYRLLGPGLMQRSE